MLRIGRIRRRDDRATSALEFSIVAPIFLLLIFTIIQAGLWFYGRNVALTSARQGVSYLRLAGTNADPDSFRGEAEDVAAYYADQIGMISGVTTSSKIDPDTGRVEVTVSGTVNLPLGDMDVTQTASATLEQFNPDFGGN